MTVESIAAPPGTGRVRRRLTGIVAGLTAANVLTAALGFISGPLLARALGPSGRGDLAAIQVPLVLAPGVLGLGISGFAYRTLPRGRPIEEIIGSLGLPLLVIGVLAAAGAVPIADVLAGGRETVRTFLIIVFVSMPLLLFSSLLLTSLAALERWRSVIVTTTIPFLVPFIAIVILDGFGHLTVATAAGATVVGSLLSLVPGLRLMRIARRPVFRRSVARNAIAFGLKSWVGGLALIANLRLDQFLMITAVAPRELGLYAVATSVAGASSAATSALMPPLMTRIAGGETYLLPQAVRVAATATVGLNLLLALATPVLLAVLFGPEFRAAVPMAFVLYAANVPFAAASVLSGGLQADGSPVIPSIGEGMALVVTVVGLLLLLGPLGGVGAAIVSLAAYSTSFLYQLLMASRRMGRPVKEFVIPTRADFRWAQSRVTGIILRPRSAP